VKNSIRTAQSALLQTYAYLGMTPPVLANSTLNQKLDIQAALTPAPTDVIATRYLAIGNGGHQIVTGVNNIPGIETLQHQPSDTGLFNQLPFVLRLPTQDLTAAQRSKYRLRRLETHDGQTYVAYYLKVLDLSQTQPSLELRTVSNGNVTSTPYTPQLTDLNPSPPAIQPGQVLQTNGDYIAATAKITVTLEADEIAELLNVANIIYGDENAAIISEMALCSAADRSVTGDFNGTSAGYMEAISVRVMNYLDSAYIAKFSNGYIQTVFDLGSIEPLMTLR
jgi:hypothetical protein